MGISRTASHMHRKQLRKLSTKIGAIHILLLEEEAMGGQCFDRKTIPGSIYTIEDRAYQAELILMSSKTFCWQFSKLPFRYGKDQLHCLNLLNEKSPETRLPGKLCGVLSE